MKISTVRPLFVLFSFFLAGFALAQPTVTSSNISITSTPTGAGGTVYIVGNTVTAQWNNSGAGDANVGVNSVDFDFSEFGGGIVAGVNTSDIWEASYVIAAGSIDVGIANVMVSADDGTPSVPVSGTDDVSVDNIVPDIPGSVVATPNTGTLIVGQVLTVTVTDANGDIGLTVVSASVNGVDVSGDFTNNADGTYEFAYTIAEGDADQTAGNVPVSIELSDASGNTGTANAFTDTNDVAIDANSPDFSGSVVASPSTGTLVVGEDLTVTVTDANSEVGFSVVSALVNGVDVSGTFSDDGGGVYSFIYTIAEGDTDQTAGNVSVSIELSDASGNTGSANAFTDGSDVAIDANSPDISGSVIATPNTGTLVVGEDLTVTVTDANSEAGFSVVSALVNGVDVSGTFSDDGGGVYSFIYTIAEGDADQTAGNVPVSIELSDASGNTGTANAFTDANDVAIDANSPDFSGSVVASPSTGTLIVGSPLIVTVTDANGDLNLTVVTATVNGVDVSGSLSNDGAGDYSFTYTVAEGDTDQTAGNVSVSIELSDAAGNTGSANAFTDGSDVAINANSPSVVSVTTGDADGDGQIDRIFVTFSEIIDAATVDEIPSAGVTDDFTITGYDIVSVTPAAGSGNDDDELVIVLVESGTPDTDATPVWNLALGEIADITTPANTNSAETGNADDEAAPALVSSIPADDATGVDFAGNIELTFSEDIALGSGDITLVDVTNGTDTRTITIPDGQLSITNNVLTIDPSSDLQGLVNYAVNVDATAIEDLAATANTYAGIADNTTLDFTTQDTPLTITDAEWLDNDGDGSIDAVVLTFNENVDVVDGNAGDGFDAIAIDDGAAVTIDNADYAASNVATLTLNFDADQILGTGITGLTVIYDNTGVTSIVKAGGGTEIAHAFNAEGYTDGAAPVLISSTPADNATGVSTGITQIDLTYSENIFKATGNVTLHYYVDDNVDQTITDADFSVVGNVAQVGIAGPLFDGAGYYVLVDAALFNDGNGNDNVAITNKDDLNFETAGDPFVVEVTWLDENPQDGEIDRARVLFSTIVSLTGDGGAGTDDPAASFTENFATVDYDDAAYQGVSEVTFDLVTPIAGTGLPANTVVYTQDQAVTITSDFSTTELGTAAPLSYTDEAEPYALSFTATPTLITDAQVGTNTFEIEIVYSESLNTATNPVISFPVEDPTGEITPNAVAFSNTTYTNDTFTRSYDVADNNATISDIDVEVDGAIAAGGVLNQVTTWSAADLFSINTAATAPLITDAAWYDTDNNGNIDRVILTFDQNVEITDGNAGDGFDGILISDGATVTIDNANYAASGVGTLTLNFTSDQITGTGISGLTVTYTQAGSNTITGSVGGFEMPDNETPAAYTDAAAPVIVNSTLDAANSYLEVSFSEGLYTSSGAALSVGGGEFIIDFQQNTGVATAVVITDYRQTDDVTPTAAGDAVIRFQLSTTGFPDGDETIEITPADGTSVYDGASPRNPMDGGESTGAINLNAISSSDAVLMVNAWPSADNSYVVLEFTRDVDTDSGTGTGAITIRTSGGSPDMRTENFQQNGGGASAMTGINTTMTDVAGNAQSFGTFWRFGLAGFTGTPDGNETFVVSPRSNQVYGTNDPRLAIGTDDNITVTLADQVAETFTAAGGTSAIAYDVNGDGTIDEVAIIMPDDIDDATIVLSDFTFGGIAASSLVASPVNPTDPGDANDNIFTLRFNGYTGTAVGSNQLTYTAGSLQDDKYFGIYNGVSGQGNDVIGGSITPQDAANPYPISATTGDSEPDGVVDYIDVLFSEDISLVGDETDFVITGYTATSATLVGTNTIRLGFVGGNTTITPNVDVSAGVVEDLSSSTNPTDGRTITNTEDGAAPFAQLSDADDILPFDTYPKTYFSLSPVITGTVDDTGSLVFVQVGGSGNLATVGAGGNWSVSASVPDKGIYDVVVTTFDSNGNVGNDVTVNEIEIDGGVIITAPDAPNVCILTELEVLDPIVFTENANGDFISTGDILLQLPTGFLFDTDVTPTVVYSGDNGASPADVSATTAYIGNAILQINFTVSGTALLDEISIQGLTIFANNNATPGNLVNMTRISGSADIFGASTNGQVFATMTAAPSPSQVASVDVNLSTATPRNNVVRHSIRVGETFEISVADQTNIANEITWYYYDGSVASSGVGLEAVTEADLNGTGFDNTVPGLYTFTVTQTNAATCESLPFTFYILVYDDDDQINPGTPTFVTRSYSVTDPVDEIYLSNPPDHTVNLSSSGSGLVILDGASDPMRAQFDPATAGLGTFNIVYTITNDLTGAQSFIQRVYTVEAAAILFNNTPDDEYCADDPTATLTMDPSQFNAVWPNLPYLQYMEGAGLRHNGNIYYIDGQELHNGSSFGATSPDPGIITAPYEFTFDPSYFSVPAGDYENVYFFSVIEDDNGVKRIGAEDYFILYGIPSLDITNIADLQGFCSDESSFTIKRNLSYVSSVNTTDPANPVASYVNETNVDITNGYVLYWSPDGIVPYVQVADFTSGPVNTFNPGDPDQNGVTFDDGDSDDVGYFRVEYTPGPVGPDGCEVIIVREVAVFDQPDMLTLSTETLNTGGAVGFVNTDEYLLEYCQYSQLPFVTLDGTTYSATYSGYGGVVPIPASSYVYFERFNVGFGFWEYIGYGYIATDDGAGNITFLNLFANLQAGDRMNVWNGSSYVQGTIDSFVVSGADVTWYNENLTPIASLENQALASTAALGFNVGSSGQLRAEETVIFYFSTTSADGCESELRKVTAEVYPQTEAPELTIPAQFEEEDVLEGTVYRFDYCTDVFGGVATTDDITLPALDPNQEYLIYTYFNNGGGTYAYVGQNQITTNVFSTASNQPAHNQSYRYYVYLTDNINPSSNFNGCTGVPAQVFMFGWNEPSAPDADDFQTGTLTYHVAEGAPLNPISHTFAGGLDSYTWYGDNGGVDDISTLIPGQSMTQATLNSAAVSDPNNRIPLNGGVTDDDESNTVGGVSFNDTYTYYVSSTDNIVSGRNFDGCESPLSPVTITVHARQNAPEIVSDNSGGTLGQPASFNDLNADADVGNDDGDVDYFFAVCSDQLQSTLVFTADETTYAGSSREFRWYSYNIGTGNRNSQTPLFIGTSADFESLLLSGLINVSVATSRYFEVVQATDTDVFAGVESDPTLVRVTVYPQEDLEFTVITDGEIFCVDDLGTDGLGNLELQPESDGSLVDDTRLTYSIESTGSVVVNSGLQAGFPVLDVDALHTAAGGSAVGGIETTHTITLFYLQDGDCEITASATITVRPTPLITFFVNGQNISSGYVGVSDAFCYDQGNVALKAYQVLPGNVLVPLTTGNFSSDVFGAITTSSGEASFNTQIQHDEFHGSPANPEYENRSTHNVTYTYTDSEGCDNTVSAFIYVEPLPEADEVANGSPEDGDQIKFTEICNDGGNITARIDLIDPTDGAGTALVSDYTGYTFLWSVAGAPAVSVPDNNEYTFTTTSTTFTVSVTAVDPNGCSSVVSESHSKQVLPTLNIPEITNNEQFCSVDANQALSLTDDGNTVNPVNVVSWQVESYNSDNPTPAVIFSDIDGESLPILDVQAWHEAANGNAFVMYDGVMKSIGGPSTTHTITITYSDPSRTYQGIATNCANTIVRSITIHPSPDITFAMDIDGNGVFTDEPDGYELCYDDTAIDLRGLFADLSTLTTSGGTFSGNGVSGTSLNNTKFDPSDAHDDFHGTAAGASRFLAPSSNVIRFEYTDQFGCDHFVEKTLIVNPSPQIEGGVGNQVIYDAICQGYPIEAHVEVYEPGTTDLVTDFTGYSFTWVTPSGTYTTGDAEIVNNYVTFSSANLSVQVTVTVTSPDGCSTTITETDAQGFPPQPSFTYVGITENSVDGMDIAIQENNASLTNTEVNHIEFHIVGVRDGVNPIIPPIVVNGDELASFNLLMDEGVSLAAGQYTMFAVMETPSGCRIQSASRTITILPQEDLGGPLDGGYTQDFTAGLNGWYEEVASENGKDDSRLSSWTLFAGTTGDALGTREADNGGVSTYYPGEVSFIYTPAFDISGYLNPAIRFDYLRDFDSNRDGVVVQVSDDDGRTWVTLGDNDINSGINWYSHQGISAGPGAGTGRSPETSSNPVLVGFADVDIDNGVRTPTWKEARHQLAVGDFSNSLIRFRFAFSALNSNKANALASGFAFDNFRIYEINKLMVVEQFSSTLSDESRTNEEFVLTGDYGVTDHHNIDWDAGTQGLLINYFTDLYNEAGAVDQINARNKVDPATRATFYGLTDVPSTRIAGQIVDYDLDTTPEDFVNGFNALSLQDADFLVSSLTLNGAAASDELIIDATFTAVTDISEEVEAAFFFAVLEKEKSGITTPVYSAGDIIPFVMRKLLPGPAGEYYKGTVTTGQDFNRSVSWTISGVDDPNNLRVVAFVQYISHPNPNKVGSIEQAAFIDITAGKMNTVTGLEELNANAINIYPNSSDDVVHMKFLEAFDKPIHWRMTDQSGRELMVGRIERGIKEITIDTERVPSGLYIIQIFNDEGSWVPKKVVIQH